MFPFAIFPNSIPTIIANIKAKIILYLFSFFLLSKGVFTSKNIFAINAANTGKPYIVRACIPFIEHSTVQIKSNIIYFFFDFSQLSTLSKRPNPTITKSSPRL